jgi:hypothetical protein
VLSDKEWDRLLDAVAARAAHTAALLDGELPPEVVADAASAGVDLLPGPGEVGPRCSCPDWANPCKHAAAVVYLMADVLDADPFALLLLRGRTRDEVLAALRLRRAGSSSGAAVASAKGSPVDGGVVARQIYAGAGEVAAPLPVVPLPPRQPGGPAPLAVDPPAESGLRSEDLAALAADAARRAWELCLGEGDGGLQLDPSLDLVRRVATGASRFEEVAARAGLRPLELGRLSDAWRIGGADAISVLGEPWIPGPELMEDARMIGAARVQGNRATLAGGRFQLRLSRGGLWYGFEKTTRAWVLTVGPASDPGELGRG